MGLDGKLSAPNAIFPDVDPVYEVLVPGILAVATGQPID
jgi:hypothetical protein